MFRLRKSTLLVLVIATVAVGGAFLLIHRSHEQKQVTASQYTKGEPMSGNSSSSNAGQSKTSSDGDQPGDAKSNSGGSSTASLLQPSGDFVSNHHPNLSGSPAPNTLTSVCTTTPGATCQIIFLKDGETKSLPSQATDRGGSVYWNWKLQDIGLDEGDWTVKAIARLNGSSESATDALKLEVRP